MQHETGNRPRCILIVDDDEIIRVTLEDRFQMEGYRALVAADLAAARDQLASESIDLVITDIRLPDGDGRDLFREVCRLHPGVPVIIMTAYISVPDAVSLIKAGAVDYLTKPFDLDEMVAKSVRAIDRAHDLGRASLISPDGRPALPGSGILGLSAAMRHIEQVAARIRDVNCAVLITGESGVGKEVVAKFIHRNSKRANGPFVAVDFATLPEAHLHAELFGAQHDGDSGPDSHLGRFRQAEGGTIFLDEIGEVPPETQVKLLRVLQEHTVEPIGASGPIPVDVRVIAATQANLESLVQAGRFRADLFWRLNVLQIEIPPLRERREDILFLARRFAAEQSTLMNRHIDGLSRECEEQLISMDFPGNVRELHNMIQRAVALSAGPRIQDYDLHLGDVIAQPPGQTDDAPLKLRENVERAERAAILRALKKSDNTVHVAAGLLGISRKTLWEKMRRYEIDRS